MSDRQPLLNPSGKVSLDDDDDNDNENNKQFSASNLLSWRQWFSKKEDNDDGGGGGQTDKNKAVGFFEIFRFADRIDLLLMVVSTLLRVSAALCLIATLIVFGQMTGLFAMESFSDSCSPQQQNTIDTIKNNISCPLGIELNPFNFVHLHKLCRHREVIESSTVATSMTSFREKVMKSVHLLLIIGFVGVGTLLVDNITWMISIRRQTSKMHVLLFRSLVQRNIAYFDTTPVSEFNADLFGNIETIAKGIGHEFVGLTGILMCIVACLIACFVVNWQLTLIMMCIIPFVMVSSMIFSRVFTNELRNGLKAYSKVGQIVEEVFSSLRTVLSLNGGKYEQKRYEKELAPTQWNDVRKGGIFGIFFGWISFISYVVYSVGFIFGSLLMSYESQSVFDLSDILIIVSVFSTCIRFLGSIGPAFQSFSEALGAAAPVFRLIDEAQDAYLNEPDICRENVTSDAGSVFDLNDDIEFDNVNFIYPARKDVPVLRNLSLIARAGQTTALVGSSGCGKSTCVSLILRQYGLLSGQIRIGDRSITNFNLKQLRQNIGIVSQEPILFAMSIYENIRFGKVNATRAEIEEAARKANAHKFIMQLPNKYETFVGERGIQLSGGEKQRIALARALVKHPSILLLDEATSALDNVSEKIVQEALDKACKNRTTIVIAHRLTTIRNADHIYVLDNGSVFEDGTHETLMAKEGGKYQAMIKRQTEKTNDDQDDLVNVEQALEEEQHAIFKRTRSLTDNEAIVANKESSTSSKQGSTFLRLLSLSSPEWISNSVGCITCALNGAAQVLFAILLTHIINAFKSCSHSERRHQVLISSLLFLLLGLFLMVLRFVESTAFAIAGSKLTYRVRTKAFACLLRQEMAYFDQPENSSSSISVRLSSDATALEQMVGARIGAICEAVAMSLFGFVFGIFFSWQLTMIVFLTFVIMLLTFYLYLHADIYLSKEPNLIRRDANRFAVEVIYNMRTIKQLSVETEILRQHSEMIHQVLKMSWKPDLANAVISTIFLATDGFVFGFLYWCALVLYEKNELDLDDIIMVFSFAVFGTQSSKILGSLANRIGSSLAAAEKFFNLFDRIPTIDNGSTEGQELVDFRGEIEFDQVKFFYPTRPTTTVLNKLQLTVKSSQRVALVGTSGCGKSTIIQLLERFYDVTQGQLRLDGVDIRQLNLHWLRSRLGLVSQEPILFDLTIAENIAYGLENVPMDEIISAATKASIHEFIQQLPQGYETKVGIKGCFLSGGEKQRIAIARIILRRPKILLLDEATSALDLYNEQIVQSALEQAQTEDPSRTSLIIAHRLSTIRSCDLICVLDNGRIVESGTHTDLIQQHGLYYEMLSQHSS